MADADALVDGLTLVDACDVEDADGVLVTDAVVVVDAAGEGLAIGVGEAVSVAGAHGSAQVARSEPAPVAAASDPTQTPATRGRFRQLKQFASEQWKRSRPGVPATGCTMKELVAPAPRAHVPAATSTKLRSPPAHPASSYERSAGKPGGIVEPRG